MDIQKIKELALANGFSLKEQASGNMDLHSYVYEFANAIEQAVKAHAATYESCSIKAHEIIINETKNELIDRYDIAKEDEYLLESLVYRGACVGKTHAVPEGFVLVSEDLAKDTERLNFLICGNKYIRTVVQRDIENDDYEKIGEHYLFTELHWIDGWDYHENTSSDTERGAIDKAMIEAMIEAKEQSHD